MAGATERASGRPRVLYVMGAGRSGSTTLGIALGNCPGLFYAGELDNWLVRSGRPQLEDAQRTRFWEQVSDALADPAAARALFGNSSQRAIERSVSVLRLQMWPRRRRLRPRYRAVAEDLYRAVTRASGATHLIDTSHYPLRARELQGIAGVELYLIYLVRDPQGVVASFNRHDVGEFTKSTLHTNVYLWATHLLSLLVFLRHPRERRLFVRYERFVADPAGTLREILTVAGAPTVALPDFDALSIGLPLQGNRVTRADGTMSLKPRTDPVPRSSLLTAALQAPVMAALSRLRPAVGVRGRARGTRYHAAP
ncbi:MAG: Sulfotransferase family [Solirubrobacterales bacterium]|nr:Sulfotransferase family [Solirubrobacterales bacterium]